jgi:hypothetical protein
MTKILETKIFKKIFGYSKEVPKEGYDTVRGFMI